MCGIAGIWSREDAEVAPRLIEPLTQRMRHRGPDASRVWNSPEAGVALGHQRLSIIDLADSFQPMQLEGHPLHIVFNGEIYNYRALRQELLGMGYVFHTHGDTEVILAAYAQWGVGCLERLRGMFAFAIWDAKKRECFFARDRFGIKPLAIYQDKGMLAFASEIQAFGGLGSVFDTQIDYAALDLYLYYGYVPAPRSIFSKVSKLPPGHYCVLKNPNDALEFKRYWSLRFEADTSLDEAQWLEGLNYHLDEAVNAHLVADVPLGAFLSGGIDSSVVVASMCKSSTSPVLACTIGFDEKAFDERAITRESSKMLSVDYREEQLDLKILDVLDVLVERYGEPFADSSAVCTYQVCASAAEHVKVMLSGDGGDEIFGGYSHYAWMLQQYMPGLSGMGRMRLKATDSLRAFGLLPERMTPHSDWIGRNAYFSAAERRALWGGASGEWVDHTERFLGERFAGLEQVRAGSLLDCVQELDILDYLPFNNLNKVDIASMCHGLEVRVPLLDHKLAEFAARIPARFRVSANEPRRHAQAAMYGMLTKRSLRKVAENTYGHGFFDRKKMGFTMPMNEWMGSEDYFPQLEDSLVGGGSSLTDYFDKAELSRILTTHREQGNQGYKLWALLFLSRWIQGLKH